MTKMFKHTVYAFDMEPNYAAKFFEKEQRARNFCGRVLLAIPEIKKIELLKSNIGQHYFEYKLECDYYGNDIADGTKIWQRLFLFYQDYVDDWNVFEETHGHSWHKQEVFDPEDYKAYRMQQGKKKFVNRLSAR